MNMDQISARRRIFGPQSPRLLTGFTLVELMVTIAVMAVLLGVAIPSFNEALLGSKLSSFANSLSSSALLARSEAIKRNAAVTLCVSSNGASCGTGDWNQGWIVKSGAEVLHIEGALPPGIRVIASRDDVVFAPTGAGATSADFTVCSAAPTVGGQERTVTIGATGRSAVAKTTNGSCS